MLSGNSLKVDTKMKAYRLVHDPVVLLNLIYSKYGDIEEDLDLLYINQLIYDKSSRYNIHFKEFQYSNMEEEFLKRFYQQHESKPRIPKLSDYYKNYHKFFCRPNFKDFVISDLMENYGDDKAELFYKNNYDNSNTNNEPSVKHNSDSLSSLDNITDNKIIFTKKAKKIIDHNLDNNYGTLTLTSNSMRSNLNDKKNFKSGLISSRSVNDSFEKIVHDLIYYKKNKNKTKYEKSRKNELNKAVKKNIQLGKKFNKQVGSSYASKKINKNIIYSLNINNNICNGNNDNNSRNLRNKNSLFSLLKSKNLINYIKTENNISSTNNNRKRKNVSLNLNKSQNKNNNLNSNSNSNSNTLYSSKNFKEQRFHLTTKLEEFHTNAVRPNTSFFHKRNKTVYFNQQLSGGNNNPSFPNNNLNHNYLNTLNNIISKNNLNSRNYIENFKFPTSKPTIFNNYITINNNALSNQKVINDIKRRIKNKTFEGNNMKNNIINKIGAMKEGSKIYFKNKINCQNNNNNDIDQIMIKKNTITRNNCSKFSLTKNTLKLYDNKNIISKNLKNNLKSFNAKVPSLNSFNKNIINNRNFGLHKKSQTTILSDLLESSSKNHICSPMSTVKQQNKNKIYTINRSENIATKMRPKIKTNKISNLNINFNNVIFNAPISNINQNINYNTTYENNINENLNYKLLTPNNKFNFNKTFSSNKNNNSHLINNNNNTSKEPLNEKLNHITNLKNFSDFSRNRANYYGQSFSQTDDNYSIIKNNYSNYGKTIYDKNAISNHTYYSLNMNEKTEIFKKKKIELIIPKPLNKKIDLKNVKKTANKSQKTKKKIEGRNKKFENDPKNYRMTENNKDIYGNDYSKTNDDYRIVNKSKIYYPSPKTTGRNNTIQPINVNRNINLISRKAVKTKQKIKMK